MGQVSWLGAGGGCYLKHRCAVFPGASRSSQVPPAAPALGLGRPGPAGQLGLLRLFGDAERVWASAGRRGGGSGRGGPFSCDRSARRLSLNLRSDRSIRYFPLLPENSILGLELGPRLNLSGNQRGGDRDTGRDRDGEIVRDREMPAEEGEARR